MKLIKIAAMDGTEFFASRKQVNSINALRDMNKGGFGYVRGYKPTSNWNVVPTVDIRIQTAFNTLSLYERRRAAIEGVKFEDVSDAMDAHPKFAELSGAARKEVFEMRKQAMIATLQKTLDGDRSGAHREAHDRCYTTVAPGVKVHFVTENVENPANGQRRKEPVLHNGLPVAESVMLNVIEHNRKYIKEGVRKVVNSGAPVLTSEFIEDVLRARKSIFFQTLSLKEDNFETLSVSGTTLDADDVESLEMI